jgi:hypothetical protein
MDYSGYQEFPFPSELTEQEKRAEKFFLALSDDEQLAMLNGCRSYEEFRNRVFARMADVGVRA